MARVKKMIPPVHLESSDKISYYDFARSILEGESLSDKLINYNVNFDEWNEYKLPSSPGRSIKIKFSDQQIKFPKTSKLNEVENKAIALNSFANHELLAIEMMASALLIFPHRTSEEIRFKKSILSALKEEQKHFSLYVSRLNEFGHDFGDFPLNDFFWRQMHKLENPAQYTAVMSLTFEAANLDFAQFYSKIFHQMGDFETAKILETVLIDEIGHVALGAHWLKKWKNNKNLWDYYLSSLPWPMTPARSKGIHFDSSLHLRAIGDVDFISKLQNYHDDFPVTSRNT